MAQQPPFDPNALAKWVVDGLKETVSYRIRQTFTREKMVDFLRSKIPTPNKVLHDVLRRTLEINGFQFEKINQGDAVFHLLRKKFRDVPHGKEVRRFFLIPGFADSPASWIPSFGFVRSEFQKNFDEVIILDFPGYLGFLSDSTMVPSMAVLLSVVKTVCELHPPTVVMGHSLGGWLAARTAQELKKPLQHLILAAPSGFIPESERQAFGDLITNKQNLTIDEIMEKMIHRPNRLHKLAKEELRKFNEKPEVKGLVESVKPEHFVQPDLPFQARKLTVIWGDHDGLVPTHWLRHWVESFGNILDAYVIKETGHLMQFERPGVFSEVLMHAILGKKGISGRRWKKVNVRVTEYDPSPKADSGGVKLLG